MNSVVANYLGRGNNEQSVPVVTEALHGPGTKKSSAKGRKRASTTTATSKAKRCKTNNVADGMGITKIGTLGADTQPAHKVVEAEATQKANATNVVQSATDSTDATKPVSVYAQTTSMASFITLDAVKAMPGYGHCLYNTVPMSSSMALVQSRSEKGPNDQKVAARPSNVTRRRSNPAQPPTLFSIEEEDEFDVLIDSLPDIVPPSKFKNKSQLPTPANSDPPPANVPTQLARKVKQVPLHQTEEDFLELDNSDDEAMAELGETAEETAFQRELTPPMRTVKQNSRTVDANEDYGGALFSAAELKLIEARQAPDTDSSNRPVTRRPFPSAILDRSPIFGATNATVLRTCFRVGEALNVGSHAVRTNKSVFIELFARVASSWREEKPTRKQYFVFQDLYHDKAPHVEGTYALWDQSLLWDADSRALLEAREDGIICRVLGRMKRDGTKMRLEVLSIWEACFDDMEYVAGVFAKTGDASLLIHED